MAAGSTGSLRLLGLVLSRFAENTNLNNHNDTRHAAKRRAHLCVGQFQYSQVRGLKTGGRIPCGGPTCFAPLFRSLCRTDLLVHPTETMRSLAGNLESQPRGRLNTSFTFVPTIIHNTPHKKEMQEKFFCQSKKYSMQPARAGPCTIVLRQTAGCVLRQS